MPDLRQTKEEILEDLEAVAGAALINGHRELYEDIFRLAILYRKGMPTAGEAKALGLIKDFVASCRFE